MGYGDTMKTLTVEQISNLSGASERKVRRDLSSSRLASQEPAAVQSWLKDLWEPRRMRAGKTKARARSKWDA